MTLCLAWAAVIAWAHHREMDPDGFSYLQIADHAAHGDIAALINAYWSPGYPAMLAVLLALFRPARATSFAFAHLLNYILFAVATFAFVFFLRAWSKLIDLSVELLIPCGFIIFLKFGIDWLGIHNCTPDLAVGIVVLLAAGIVCRIAGGASQWKFPTLLGIVLAAGYYIKAVVFPLALLLLIVLFLFPPAPRVSRLAVLFAAAIFAVTSLPLIMLESRVAGRSTFGETGRLNYAWYVNGAAGVQRVALDTQVHLVHPLRRIFDNPVTLEFATPIQATYPLWYDPYYWSQGIQASFNIRQQIAAMKITLMAYADMGIDISVLIAAAAVLLATGSGAAWLGKQSIWLVVWPLGCLAAYSLVHTESRFLGGFMAVLWTATLSAGLRWTRIVSKGAILALIGITLLLPTSFRLALAVGRTIQSVATPGPTSDMVTAQALRSAGLHDGDRIAVVGETFEPYYAWIAKLNVVAQVLDPDELSRLSPADFQNCLAAVERTGAKALVTMDRPPYSSQIRWQDLPVMLERSSTIGGLGPHRFSIYILEQK